MTSGSDNHGEPPTSAPAGEGTRGEGRWRAYAEAALPAVLFLVLFGVSLYVVEWLGRTGPLDNYTIRVAAAAAFVLRAVGLDAHTEGAKVVLGQGTGVVVGWQCCGLSLAVPVAAFFLAFPAPWARRLVAAAVALVGVQVLNVLRVAALVVISDRAREYLVLSHDTFWNAFVIAVVLLVWVIWSGRARNEAGAGAG